MPTISDLIIYDPSKKTGIKLSCQEWFENRKDEANSLKFCPLIVDTCNPKCVCFNKPTIMSINDREVVLRGYCTNKMFKKG